MKKILVLLMSVILFTGLCACGSGAEDSAVQDGQSGQDGSASLNVVTTIFPVYDWSRNIAGSDKADISMLIDSGVDLHSYQPSAEDIVKISECDVFIYVGGESDEWVEDVLEGAVNKDMVVVNLMKALGDKAKEEEIVEGMQEDEHEHEHGDADDADHDDDDADDADHDDDNHDDADDADHDEDADHDDEHEHGDEEGPEYDEHIWLSLQNASVLADVIANAFAEADDTNAEAYKSNAAGYQEKLAALDGEYAKAVKEGSTGTLLFGDRFPFRYMTDDYGLDYFAAFVGCSAETEASFETIAFLSDKVDELGLKNVMTIEGADHSIAESIINNTKSKDQTILTLDSMQSTTAEDVAAGADYLSIMEENLEILRQAVK